MGMHLMGVHLMGVHLMNAPIYLGKSVLTMLLLPACQQVYTV
jgi:hypothetical protein